MASTIQLKRSSVAGKVPDAANVEIGEPVVNFADRIIFTKNTTGSVIVIGAGTTSNVTEGVNLYYSNARVYANVAQLNYITASALSGYATNTQLASYATNAQLTAYATTANLALKANSTDLTTANVVELNNLYFTNTRTYANIVAAGFYDTVSNTAPIGASESGTTLTLSHLNSGVTAATYGGATVVPTYTVNSTGHITSASNVTVQVSNTNIVGNIISSQITSIANSQITGNIISSQLQPTGVTSATYGNAKIIPSFTVDQQGRITSASNISISSGLSTWTRIVSNYTASAGDRLVANTIGGSFAITLPASPAYGDEIYIADGYDFSTFSANVARNGNLIEGASEDLTIDLRGVQVQLVFSGNSNWKLYYTSTFQSDNWVPLTANVTAKVRERFIANTISRPLYVTLPAAPDLGDYIKVADGYDFRSNSVFIVRSAGNKINRVDEDLEIDVRGVSVELVYDGYNNWQVYYTSATGEITTSIARAAISVTGAGSYDNTTGIITITGGVSSVAGATGNVSNAQIQAVFTAGDGISLANGIIALANTIDYGLITGALDATNDYGSIV